MKVAEKYRKIAIDYETNLKNTVKENQYKNILYLIEAAANKGLFYIEIFKDEIVGYDDINILETLMYLLKDNGFMVDQLHIDDYRNNRNKYLAISWK